MKLLVPNSQYFHWKSKNMSIQLFWKHLCSPWNPKKRYTFLGSPGTWCRYHTDTDTSIGIGINVWAVSVSVWIISLVSVWMISLVSVSIWWYRWNTRQIHVLNFWLLVQKWIRFAPHARLVSFFLLRLLYIKLGQNSYDHIKSSFIVYTNKG